MDHCPRKLCILYLQPTSQDLKIDLPNGKAPCGQMVLYALYSCSASYRIVRGFGGVKFFYGDFLLRTNFGGHFNRSLSIRFFIIEPAFHESYHLFDKLCFLERLDHAVLKLRLIESRFRHCAKRDLDFASQVREVRRSAPGREKCVPISCEGKLHDLRLLRGRWNGADTWPLSTFRTQRRLLAHTRNLSALGARLRRPCALAWRLPALRTCDGRGRLRHDLGKHNETGIQVDLVFSHICADSNSLRRYLVLAIVAQFRCSARAIAINSFSNTSSYSLADHLLRREPREVQK